MLLSREVIQRLHAEGWVEKRVRGSHHIFGHPTKPGFVPVPHPKKDLDIRVIRSIEKLSGVKLR